jgi:hypothetical protein
MVLLRLLKWRLAEVYPSFSLSPVEGFTTSSTLYVAEPRLQGEAAVLISIFGLAAGRSK